MRKNIFCIAFLCSIGSIYQPLFAQSDLTIKQQIDKVEKGLIPAIRFEGDSVWTLDQRMKHYGVPGLSIAVIKDSKVVWVKHYGITDKKSRQPVTSQTLFQAASISKPVSAYAALKEVQDGKINLDTDINQYLKSWKLPANKFTAQQKVTLKQLLNHTAGITVGGFLGYTINQKVPTLLQILNGLPPANSPAIVVDKLPGVGFRYAGGGYLIIQQTLIDLEKKPYPAIMQDLVLKPLGMKNSLYGQPLPAAQLKLAATGYLPDGKENTGKRHTYPELAAAGLWTTTADLAKFVIDIQLSIKGQSNKVLSKDMATLMLTPYIEKFTGLGIFLNQYKEDVYFEHSGWNEGFSSQLVANKDKGYGVVILTNANQPQLIQEIIRSTAAAYDWSNYLKPIYQKLPMDIAELQRLSGRYRFEQYEVVTITNKSGHLYYSKGKEAPLELFKIADNTFIRKDWDTKIQIAINPQDNQQYFSFLSDGQPVSYDAPLMKADEKVLSELLTDGDYEKALAAYRDLKRTQPDNFAVQEQYINQIGYQLLQNKTTAQQSINAFKINTQLYPKSYNTFDSLGEAYLQNGNKDLARQNYQLSLLLNPANDNAIKMIKQLSSK